MIITITPYDVMIGVLAVIGMYILFKLFDKIIFPWIIDKKTKDIEKNPKWITSGLREKYYGFNDIDIITVNSPFGMIPRFRLDKNRKDRLQLLISEETSTQEVDTVAQLALAGKIKVKYGLWFPDKPVYWLSILLYMLDGGDVRQEATRWESATDNKPIDLSKKI